VPDLRRHRQFALDDRDDPRVIDAQLRRVRQHAVDGAAAVIAHLEAAVVEAAHDTVERARRGARGQDARQAPADGEVGRRFEQGVGQHAAGVRRRTFERLASGSQHLVPGEQVDDVRDVHTVELRGAYERGRHSRRVARPQLREQLEPRVRVRRRMGC